MTKSWDELFSTLDRYIKDGKSDEAARQLQATAKGHVSREARAPMAALARRAGQPHLALRLLNPIVRPDRKRLSDPTDVEKAEYAASLSRIGAVEEALALLDSLNGEALPEVWAYKALALVSQWRYAETIPLLLAYVNAPAITEYQRSVGKINLASAYTYERLFSESRPLIDELLALSAEQRFPLLGGKILGVAAEDAIARHAWKEAEDCLHRAELVLGASTGIERLFARKWRAVMRLFRERGTGEATLEKVRREAGASKHWETLRELDRFDCLVRHDERLLWRIYFGTPFDGYRKRLLSDFGFSGDLPGSYEWRAGPRTGAPVRLDLATAHGNWQGRSFALKPGNVSHRLLTLLASDFYRPFRQASVHSALYPGEYFNPVSSPLRVREALHRLRLWLESHRVPIEVRANAGFVALHFARAARVRVEGEIGERRPRSTLPLKRLSAQWRDREFSLEEASRALEVSPRSTLRLLQSGVSEGFVERTGKARATRYRLKGRR